MKSTLTLCRAELRNLNTISLRTLVAGCSIVTALALSAGQNC